MKKILFVLLMCGCKSPTAPDIQLSASLDSPCVWLDYNHPPSIVPVIPSAEEQFCIDAGYGYLSEVEYTKGGIVRLLCCDKTLDKPLSY
jgi:hypothetical protein